MAGACHANRRERFASVADLAAAWRS
jgi:hypothetical protein